MPISLHSSLLLNLCANLSFEAPISTHQPTNQPIKNKQTNEQAKKQLNLSQSNQSVMPTTLDHVSINAALTWVNT